MTLLLLLLTIQTVKSIGVTSPIPIDLKLLRGDTARFYFEIMASTSKEKISCTYSVNGFDPLVITFDEKETIVEAGEIKPVYGTVSVPNNAPIKSYVGSLVAACGPYVETKDVSGSIIHQSINVKFVIDVVETKEERAILHIEEEEKPKASPIILVLIIIVLILAIVGFLFSRKKPQQ
jgi:hypothetical protein